MKLLFTAWATIALFVGLFLYPGWLRHSSNARALVRPDAAQLQLKVEHANGDLLLTWNRDAEIVKNAGKTVLSISDGDRHYDVDLDPAQLAAGQIVYSPAGTDIRFEMRVTGKSGQTTTGQLRTLTPQ